MPIAPIIAEELLKVTAVCPTVCNLSCEREDVTLDPNKVCDQASGNQARYRGRAIMTDNSCATSRAMVSIGPPGGNGTIILITRFG